jgi:hypothetical protein
MSLVVLVLVVSGLSAWTAHHISSRSTKKVIEQTVQDRVIDQNSVNAGRALGKQRKLVE